MSDYQPRDGSIAYQVMQLCAQRGAMSTTTICEEIEEATRSNLLACLSTGIRMGAVFVRKIEGETWYDVKPFAVQPGDDEGGVDMDRAHVTKDGGATARRAAEREESRPMHKEQSAIPPPAEFVCGLFSDGRFVLEFRDGSTQTLERADTEKLIAFVDRLSRMPEAT